MSNKIEGLDKLNKQFGKLKNLKFIESVVEGAEVILEYSKRNTPVKTGFLRDNQEVVETEQGAEIRINADYAFAVEFGTSKMNAQPFLRPAIEEHRKEMMSKISDDMEKKIKKEVNK